MLIQYTMTDKTGAFSVIRRYRHASGNETLSLSTPLWAIDINRKRAAQILKQVRGTHPGWDARIKKEVTTL